MISPDNGLGVFPNSSVGSPVADRVPPGRIAVKGPSVENTGDGLATFQSGSQVPTRSREFVPVQ